MREENGDIMQKLKKAAAVAVMVGGIGLAGGGVASAGNFNDPYPVDVAANNVQLADCQQTFDSGAAFAPVNGAVTGDLNQNIGNFCANVNVPR